MWIGYDVEQTRHCISSQTLLVCSAVLFVEVLTLVKLFCMHFRHWKSPEHLHGSKKGRFNEGLESQQYLQATFLPLGN